MIRLQANYIFIVKIRSVKSLYRMLNEFSCDDDKLKLNKMYNYCCKDSFGSFLLIDFNSNQTKMYRKNYDEYLNINDF